MTNEDMAKLWNQHEICPECRGRHIKGMPMQIKSGFKQRFEKKYMCLDCNCQWMTNE